MKGNGYIDNYLDVVCAEMFLQIKTAANRSFLVYKFEKVAIQPIVPPPLSMNPPSTQRGEPPSLAQVELHPILCPSATTTTCTPQVLPQTQHQAGCW